MAWVAAPEHRPYISSHTSDYRSLAVLDEAGLQLMLDQFVEELDRCLASDRQREISAPSPRQK